MPKSLFVRDLINIENVFFGCVVVTKGVFHFLRSVFFRHYISIFILFATGVELYLLRELIFWAAPHLKHGAAIIADVITALEVIFKVFFDIFIGIFDATSYIIYAIEAVVCSAPLVCRHVPGHPKTIPFESFKNQSYVTPSQVRHALDRVTVACVKYDSVPEMMTLLFRNFLGPTVCPMVRYLYPVHFLYESALKIFWFTPDPTPIGYAGENNCQETDENKYDFVCTIMGSGFIVLELILPLWISTLFLWDMTVPILHFISVILRLAVSFTETVYRVTHFIVTSMDESLLWLIDEVLLLKRRSRFQKSKDRPLNRNPPSR